MFSWLVLEKAIRFGVAFVVGAAVARHLGVEIFGALSRALAFAGLFGILSSLGLDTILKRDLVACPEDRDDLLATAFGMRIVGAILGLVVLAATSWIIMDGASGRIVALVAGLPMVVVPFFVLDLDLQSQMRGRAVAIAQFTGSMVSASWRIVLIEVDAPLVWFAASIGIELLATLCILATSAPSGTIAGLFRKPRLDLVRRFVSEGWPLIIAGGAIGLYLRMDQVMLGQIRGETDTGLYAAAVRLAEVGGPVAMIMGSTLLPGLVRSQRPDLFEAASRRAFALASFTSIALAVVGTFAAPFVIPLCFGHAYDGSIPVFMILIWSNVLVFTGVIRSQVLAARSSPRFLMVAACLGAAVNFLLNLWWIPLAGPVGAGWATLVSYASAAWLSTLIWRPVRDVGLWQTSGLLWPWRAYRRTAQ